ncbi:DUF4198 domain-containing protein [Sphingomonas sp. LR60]|uniref:DUF4198 domain-containing protein n=1 Tax=Sphingomonas sp. LR60 TaxID=3050233 RepID=UPI002FE27EAD
MIKLFLAAALLGTSTLAAAHEVWIERDGSATARIYLGEPAEPVPAGGDPEFTKLKAPRLVPSSRAAMVRRNDHIEVAAVAGDVRAWDDNVFAPWGPATKREAVVYYARAGRIEPKAVLPFEIVPVATDADRFTVIRDGRPLADTEVTFVTPARETRKLRTDARGVVVVPTSGSGRYLLSAAAKDEGERQHGGMTVHTLHYITTTSYHAG